MTPQYIDFDAIRASIPVSSIVSSVVNLRTSGHELMGNCPFHEDDSPSFFVNDDKRFYHCFGCSAHGDVIDFVANYRNVEIAEAVRILGHYSRPMLRHQRVPAKREKRDDNSSTACTIWRAAKPATGTEVEQYLKSRGITIVPPSIRFARLAYGGKGGLHPTLVAAVQSATGPVQGVQRIFLRADGAGKLQVSAPKLSLGKIKGGAIRLGPVAHEIVLTEGLEDGLTISQAMPSLSVWVCCGTEMLPAVEMPETVRTVVIGADNDAGGKIAADKAGDAYTRRGLAVRIMRPAPGFKDFNDELRGIRHDG